MEARPTGLVAVLVLCVATAGSAAAADQSVAGTRLLLQRKGAEERLVFVVKDPSAVLPAAGSVDDPAVSSGLRVVLFGRSSSEMAEIVVPPGNGWMERTAPTRLYRYRNGQAPAGSSPVRLAVLRDGGLRIVAREVGLALSGPEGSVGVRLEMGSTRLCALFDGASVRRDQANLFLARGALSPGLVECTDDALFAIGCSASFQCGGVCPEGMQCVGAPFSCTCVTSPQPCGATASVCNGECPAGEVCANVGGLPYPGCACLPEGSMGCGTVHPMCGDGECPAGLSCYADSFTCCGGLVLNGCSCLSAPPPPPCGGPCPPGSMCLGPAPNFPQACYPTNCAGGPPCPAGSTCESFGGGLYCLPIPCSGGSGYQTCDGSCPSGLTCEGFSQGSGSCSCAP